MDTPAELHNEPTPEEIAAAHIQTWNAKITGNLGTPSMEVAQQILDVRGQALDPTRLYVMPGQPSSNYVDTYFTYMLRVMLDTFVANATEGRALLRVHDHDSLAVGYSYGGEIIEDPQPSRPDLIPKRLVGQPFYRMLEYFYMVRGMEGVDDLIEGIETRIYRDLSVGFIAEKMFCDICDNDMFGWDCWHIPGVEYDVNHPEAMEDDWLWLLWSADGSDPIKQKQLSARLQRLFGLQGAANSRAVRAFQQRLTRGARHPHDDETDDLPPQWELCVARIEAGQLLETSLVFKGACPEAAVAAIKARMVASAGRLTQREANRLQRLEVRVGRPLLDPWYYKRVRTLSLPPGKEPLVAQTKTVPAAPARGKRATDPAPAADPNADPNATDPNAPDTQDGDLEQVVADLSTGLAAGLSGQISALQGEIDAKTKELSDANDELAELQSGGGDGDTDTSEDIADQQQLIANLQTELSALQQEMAALQKSLAAANTAADATGGASSATPGNTVDDQGNPVPPATTTQQADSAHTPLELAVAGLTRAAGITNTRLAPVLVDLQLRKLKQGDCSALVRASNDLITLLQEAIRMMGGTPVRTLRDQNMLGLLARALGVAAHEVRVNHMTEMLTQADEGRAYRARLVRVCKGAKVRAVGAGDEVTRYERSLAHLSLAELEDEADRAESEGSKVWQPGRRVVPESAAEDQAARERTPARNGHGATSHSNGAGGSEEPERVPPGVYPTTRRPL